MTYLDLSPSEDLKAGQGRIRGLLDGETSSYSVERRYVRKNGFYVWVALHIK